MELRDFCVCCLGDKHYGFQSDCCGWVNVVMVDEILYDHVRRKLFLDFLLARLDEGCGVL